MPGSPFSSENNQKAQETRRRRREELARLPPLKIHGGRLSVADYLNEPEPPRITRDEAIKLHCLDCVGDALAEVRACTAEKCSLWPYRLGAYQRPGQDYWASHRKWDPEWKTENGRVATK